MKLKPIIQELRAHCPGFNGRVFGVGTFSRLDESVAAELLPAAFVIPVSEDPEEPAVINRYKQQVRFNFAVILMVANTEDEQGLTAWEKSVDLKKEVFQAFWEPTIFRPAETGSNLNLLPSWILIERH